MQFNLLAVIGIALLAMFFGYGFGLFEGRGQGYKRRKKEEAAEANRRPVVQPAPASPPPLPKDSSLLRLALDDGRPSLSMDGQPLETAQLSAQQRKRLIDLMVMMRPWIEPGNAASARPPAAPEPPAPSGISAAAQRTTVPLFDGQPVTRTTGPLKIDTGPLGTPEPPVPAPTTMVGQIDAILQTRLAGTPLAGRGIRLVESAQGGAMVVVGLQRYAGVGDVPDPEIQSAIRAAITAWEKKFTPG